MSRISIKEFESLHGEEEARYPKSIADRAVEAWMIEFDDPEQLCGPFAEKYGLATIVDHRKMPSITTESKMYNDFVESQAMSAFNNYPLDVMRKAGIPNSQEYVLARYRKGTLEAVSIDDVKDSIHVMTPNILAGSRTLENPHAVRANYGKTTLTGLDVIRVMREMVSTMDKADVLAMLDKIEGKIGDNIASFMAHDWDSSVTIERPYTLSITGTDDASWGKVFGSVTEAQECLAVIEKSRSLDFVREQLKFTN